MTNEPMVSASKMAEVVSAQNIFKAKGGEADFAGDCISAAAIIQATRFCCDRLRVLTISEQYLKPTCDIPVVKMSSITFKCFKEPEDGIVALRKDGMNGSGLSNCVAISVDTLETLFGNQRSLPPSTDDQKLHICALTVQMLCLALVLYAQGHTGELHPIFLKSPLIEVTLERSLMNQPCIVADLRELACMGGCWRARFLF